MASFNLPPFASTSTIAYKATRQTCFVALPVAVLPHVSCSGAPVAQRGRRHHRTFWAHQALPPETPQQAPQGEQDEFDGLLPEEDTEVPGGYTEAMNPQTRLGKAVSAACKELGTLNSLERSNLEEADSLLKKLGFKMSLMPTDPPAFDDADDEEAVEGGQDSAAAAPSPEPAKLS